MRFNPFTAHPLQHLPQLSAWVRLCYGAPSNLVAGKHVVPSQSGVQQGDPLGPALFALAIHPAEQAARREAEAGMGRSLHLSALFMDNGTVAGDAATVAAWYASVTPRFRDIGLEVNPSRCCAVRRGGSVALHDVDLHACRAHVRGLPISETGNFKLLGAAFGTLEFCDALVRKRAAKARLIMGALGDFPSSCIAPGPPICTEPAWQRTRGTLAALLTAFSKCPPTNMQGRKPSSAWGPAVSG